MRTMQSVLRCGSRVRCSNAGSHPPWSVHANSTGQKRRLHESKRVGLPRTSQTSQTSSVRLRVSCRMPCGCPWGRRWSWRTRGTKGSWEYCECAQRFEMVPARSHQRRGHNSPTHRTESAREITRPITRVTAVPQPETTGSRGCNIWGIATARTPTLVRVTYTHSGGNQSVQTSTRALRVGEPTPTRQNGHEAQQTKRNGSAVWISLNDREKKSSYCVKKTLFTDLLRTPDLTGEPVPVKKGPARAILRENSLSLAFAAGSPHEGADDTAARARTSCVRPFWSDRQRITRARMGGIEMPAERWNSTAS